MIDKQRLEALRCLEQELDYIIANGVESKENQYEILKQNILNILNGE